jgi:menaquinone-9 beta-reductase
VKQLAFPGRRTDVFVIGGGPAGLAAGIAARRKGFTVTVADGTDPPIDKACGEGMMPDAQVALRELGVELPAGLGYRFRGIRFLQNDAQVAADFTEGQGIGVRRTLLHAYLIQAADKSGVKLLWKTPVIGIDSEGVCLSRGTVATRWIVAADGGFSRVRRWCGLDTTSKPACRLASRRHYRVRPWTDYMEVYWGHRAQAYVTSTSAEEVCIVTIGESPREADFGQVLDALPDLSERLAGAERTSRERGAMTATRSLTQVWRGNVALVGDASGGVDAITGEGLRLAFRQAQALAEAMYAGDLCGYGRAHRKLVNRPLQMSKVMLQLGRHDRLRSRIFRVLSSKPELFARLLAVHVGQATPGDTVAAGARLAWQLLAG